MTVYGLISIKIILWMMGKKGHSGSPIHGAQYGEIKDLFGLLMMP
jgi:hypothetical protein